MSRTLRSVSVRPLLAVLACCAPLAAQEPLFTFAQVSDSQPQTSTDNQRFVDVLRTISEGGQSGALLPRPVDLVLFAGDITWGNTRSEWTAAKAKLDTWLTANDIPYLAVPGNHDVNNSDVALYEEFIGSAGVWDAGSAAFTGQNGRARLPNWRGLRFIGINNSNPGWNTIRAADLSEVQARVAAAQAAQENIFFLCHHPHDEKERMPLAALLPNPSAVGYLHGHAGSPGLRKGLAGVVNPNLWDVCSNAIYEDGGLVYVEVFPTELRVRVARLVTAPGVLPAPVVVPLVHALTPVAEPNFGLAGPLHAGARPTPTARTPERKLWRAQGSWWSILWSSAAGAHRIHRYEPGTQSWLDVGPVVPGTSARSFDALAGDSVVVVASNLPSVPSQAGNGSPGQLSRFTFDAGLGRYVADAGYPVAVNDARSPSLVVARDSMGLLWTAWTRAGSVFVAHSTQSDAQWAAPLVLAEGVGAADTVALVAFDGQIGALWTRAGDGSAHFARHLDGLPENDWSFELAAAASSVGGTELDLAASAGELYAALRGSDGGLKVLTRDARGDWSTHPAGSAADALTQPLLVVDVQRGLLRLFATAPTFAGRSALGGGALYTKVSPLTPLAFPGGRGTPVIQDGLRPSAGFASSTRATVDGLGGLLVLGSVAENGRYWHAFDALGPPLLPLAEFSAAQRSGPAPLVVDFQDLSSGGATYWSWDFGDGAGAEEQNPRHVYTQPGSYTVRLRAASGYGEDERVRTAYVDVTAAPAVQVFRPVADARVYQASANSNYGADPVLRVKTDATSSFQTFLRFDLSSFSGSALAARLRLFCTDGSNAGGSVYAIANDTWGESTITWNNKPALPGAPLVVQAGVSAGFWIEIDLPATVVESGLVSLALAGGSTNSAYYSSREGANAPELVVTRSGSGTAPTAAFSGTPLSGPAPLTVQFSDASSGAPSAWSWDFGDGSGSSQRHPAHTYSAPGTYTVVLDASNGNGLDSLTRLDYVVVTAPPPVRTFVPVADARVTESSANKNYGAESTLRLRNQAGGSVHSYLRFDLASLSGAVTSAKLRLFCSDASSSGGELRGTSTGWSETGLTWANRPAPGAAVLATLGAVSVGQWIEIDVSSAVSGPGQVGFALLALSSNTCLYSSREGANPPELVVTTGAGGPPTAAFAATPVAGGAPLTVAFQDLSSGATSWTWDFGDGSGSNLRDPLHVYTAPGTYSVLLRVANGSGEDSLLRTDLVSVTSAPPVRTFLPAADARVNEASPNSNAGLDPILRVRQSSGASYHTYLRFDLSTLSGPVQSAKLRLFSSDGSDVAGQVFPTSGSWSETAITWNNRPGASGALITSTGTVATGAWAEFDVTAAVNAGAQLDLVLLSTSTNSCYYSSREGTQPPELVVTTGTP